MVDKNDAIIQYLITCPAIATNPLFFNFGDANDNINQIVTYSDDVDLHKKYIDGTVEKRFTFGIVTYKSIMYNQIVKTPGYSDENVEDFLDVQSIIDWIEQQNELRNFPNFGPDCEIDKIEAVYGTPNIVDVKEDVTPQLAQYETVIRVEYLDTSRAIWK